MSIAILRLPTGCAAFLLIAAAPPAQGHVSYAQDGDIFRLESGKSFRVAGIDTPETHANTGEMQAEIALGRSATALARMLFDGRTVTIMRVGRSYDRTVARVTLPGHDVGSERVATGFATRGRAGTANPTGARAR